MEFIQPNEVVKDDDKVWNVQGMVTAEGVKTSKPQERMRAQPEKCCSANVEIPAEILAVTALAEQNLDLKR